MPSKFDSIWPVPIGFLVALLVLMAFFLRKRFFSCLKGKQNSIESGTYTQNGELNAGLDHPTNADVRRMETTPAQGIINGQQSHSEITEYPILILPNRSSGIEIISASAVNDTLSRRNHQGTGNEQDAFGVEAPPPSYSSLFYCPPPKYEDVVVTAQ